MTTQVSTQRDDSAALLRSIIPDGVLLAPDGPRAVEASRSRQDWHRAVLSPKHPIRWMTRDL